MQIENKNEEYLNPDAKVYITRNFQSFIKPKNYNNTNKKLKHISVEFLTENFEPKDVDNDKIYAENEFYYLSENNEDIKNKLEDVKNYSNHSDLMLNVGQIKNSCSIKQKLLKKLEESNKNENQSSEEFSKKFENVLKKENSKFIENCFQKMKGIEHSVGLEFAGSLLEMVQANDEILINLMENSELGPEVEMPEEYERAHILSDNLIMFAQDARDNDDYGVSELTFYRTGLSNDKTKFELNPLKLEKKYSSRNYIYHTKYFEQSNVLILLVRPGVDENTIIMIYELQVDEDKIRMEPLHKIETESEHVDFFRANGIDYIVYTMNKYEQKENFTLSLASLADTLENPKMKPHVQEIPMDILYYRPFKLNSNLLLIEGDKDELALLDITTKEFIAYNREHKKQDYFNYFQASYAKSKNLLFLLHNNQSGAMISSFSVDAASRLIVHKEDFALHETLKNSKLNPYINQYFIMQFNAITNRLNVTDDDFQILFTLKINQQSKLEKDKEPLKLSKFEIRDSSCWGHFLMLEGESYFMHYFPYDSILRLYKLKDD